MIFVPKSSYSKDELIDCSEGNLFAPEHGRLPADEMLMFDCIKEINDSGGNYSNGYIHAELDINPDLWFCYWWWKHL